MKSIIAARLLGATSLELNVNRHNKARSFYEKQGFTITGEEILILGKVII